MSEQIEDRTPPELPRGLALAWGIRENPHRGPKRELSIEAIVASGVDIADARGLGAVSMAAVAKSLGYTTMSLYRYVTSKDDLLLLMAEQAQGAPPAGVADAPTWRESLMAFHAAALELYRAHPWLLDLPISGTPLTPNALSWLDASLQGLAGTGLPQADLMSMSVLISGHARFQASMERGHQDAADGRSGDGATVAADDAAVRELLRPLVSPEAFPGLSRVLDSDFFETEVRTLEFGVQPIIDGLAVHVLRTGGDPGPVPGSEEIEDPFSDPVTEARRSRDQERELISEVSSELETPRPPNVFPQDPQVRRQRERRREAEVAVRTARRQVKEAGRSLREALTALRDSRREEQDAITKARARADKG